MRCFYHRDFDAVGVCKSCGRGLCPECAVIMDRGLACRGHCEADVQELTTLIKRNISMSPIVDSSIRGARRSRLFYAAFYLAMGVIFIGFSVKTDIPYFLVFGGLIIAFGLMALIRALRMPKISPDRE